MDLKQPLEKSDGTRGRILAAAESLFAKNGVTKTTLREITQAARVNMAAVNYHFGSKESLANAVFRDLAERVNDHRRAAIAECVAQARASGTRPAVADLVDIFLEPYISRREPWTSMLLVHLVMLHRIEPTPWTREIITNQFDPLAREFVEALRLALPDRDEDEFLWRYYFMPGTVIFALSDARNSKRLLRLSQGRCDSADLDRMARELRAVLINLFEGPPVAELPEGKARRAGAQERESRSGLLQT